MTELKAGDVLVNLDNDRETTIITHAHQQNDRYWLGLPTVAKTKATVLKDWKLEGEQPKPKEKETPTGKIPIIMEDIKEGTLMIGSTHISNYHMQFQKVKHINKGDMRYMDTNGHVWKRVIFDSEQWVVWFGGDCPLPDGVVVEVHRRNVIDPITKGATKCNWKFDLRSDRDIIAYRVVGLTKGYSYPWE